MARTIWKFTLPVDDRIALRMPRGAKPLTVQMQSGLVCLWALVDPEAEPVRRTFAVRGTGHPADGLAVEAYVGTFQARSGALVFHVFDCGEQP